jgi:hypothetical protein
MINVCHRYDVQDEDKMVDCVDNLVGNAVSEIRGLSDRDSSACKCVPSAHDLRREPLAVFLFLVKAQGSTERDKGEGGKEDKINHTVTKVHVNAHCPVQWNEAIKYGPGKRSDREP